MKIIFPKNETVWKDGSLDDPCPSDLGVWP